MSISPFFLQLRSAYQAELDDLSSDSEGRDVLKQRLAAKRNELDFLRQMIEISPEMVAVVFHQGFRFKLPGVMDHLISCESDGLPSWESLADAAQLTPAAQAVADELLCEQAGGWLITVAAALEYMHAKPNAGTRSLDGDDPEDDEPKDRDDDGDDDQDGDGRSLDEAGADWLAEQGFDQKD